MSDDSKLTEIRTKYEGLETKHRWMLLALVFALLFAVFEVSWYQSQMNQEKQLKRQLAQVRQEQQDLLNANESRQIQLTGAALNQKRQQLKALQQQNDNLNQSLSQYAHLVSPKQMPELLREFFTKSSSLRLVSLKKFGVKPAFGTQSIETNTTPSSAVSLYRHEFKVTLRGGYFQLLKSLRQLETMNIKIYWEGLNYTVDTYPNADIDLTVYTFSYDKNWIGV